MGTPHKTTARRFRISGRVQGVGYRYFVYHSAGQLQLRGYVMNLPDGDVEVYAIGDFAQLERLKEKLLQGPGMARVTHLDESAAPVDPDYTLFNIEGG
ncbi:MAG: acylphosphatase [Acidobacteriia bacterium]|nr:acylphosphatase [Terriglobia bacterium]